MKRAYLLEKLPIKAGFWGPWFHHLCVIETTGSNTFIYSECCGLLHQGFLPRQCTNCFSSLSSSILSFYWTPQTFAVHSRLSCFHCFSCIISIRPSHTVVIAKWGFVIYIVCAPESGTYCDLGEDCCRVDDDVWGIQLTCFAVWVVWGTESMCYGEMYLIDVHEIHNDTPFLHCASVV